MQQSTLAAQPFLLTPIMKTCCCVPTSFAALSQQSKEGALKLSGDLRKRNYFISKRVNVIFTGKTFGLVVLWAFAGPKYNQKSWTTFRLGTTPESTLHRLKLPAPTSRMRTTAYAWRRPRI